MTTYPFTLPAELQKRLPPPSPDGNHYVDVRVAGKWDGILVVDGLGVCVGVYIRRQVEPHPLPFDASEIEDIRPASLWNRSVACIPFDLWDAAVLTIVILSPLTLSLAWFLWPLLALVSVLECAVAIYIMYLAPGFPLIRLPVALLGLCQIILGMALVLRSLW